MKIIGKICPLALTALLGACGQQPSSPVGQASSSQGAAQAESNSPASSDDLVSAEVDQENDAQLEALQAEKSAIESRMSEINVEMSEAQDAQVQVNAAAAQEAGIGAVADLGNLGAAFDIGALDLDALAIDADAIQDLIDAAMDGDVDGVIDALMDLVAALGAELDALQVDLDAVNAQIDAIEK
ncbi:hypothetical protein [Pseudobacteriovorax antillogorgiicola]|uniref:Uncharacterized protein n=1 Tax=Pseudobacteriovorax antillogorgiicola TaxID=1513793 RepID=A0A1Y6BJZ5_9BACT|nr:hypothetical protein [Pseudobacteriovorax antillogorgiicola]TCS56296.1 hypothetical protein EDD56_104118 [Pseudobacteriovorax antillogorgiicola]SMF07408.1 hypothetical protein SAMN06296036_104215 [Pseudobacteriovorax antillogorgiicola]